MAHNNINKLHNALYCIRKENNCIKIRLTRMKIMDKVKEAEADGKLNKASLYFRLLNELDCLSDIEMSNDES